MTIMTHPREDLVLVLYFKYLTYYIKPHPKSFPQKCSIPKQHTYRLILMEPNFITNLKKNQAKFIKSKKPDDKPAETQAPVPKTILPSLTLRETHRNHRRNKTVVPGQAPVSISPCKVSSKLGPIAKAKLPKQDYSQLTDSLNSSPTLPMKHNAYSSLSPPKQGPSRFLPVSKLRPQVKRPELYNTIKAFAKDFQSVFEKRSEKINDYRYSESPNCCETAPREIYTWEEGLSCLEFDNCKPGVSLF